MKIGRKILLRVGMFGALVVATLLCLNSFFQPVWSKWNNYYTTHGFYEEPENTIETLFLGASIVLSSVSPMDMYNEYGISAYNLGTEQQPMLGSYYWLEEVYDLHSETLKTVVLDVSALRSTSKQSFYHKCFDSMRFSDIKFRAIRDYVGGGITETIYFMVPLISYHSRWSSLEESDFEKYSLDPDIGTRGYYYIDKIYADKVSYSNVKIKNTVLDKTAEPAELVDESLYYLDKMVDFCNEKGIKLVLMKTVTNKWSSDLHNAVAPIAESYGLDFFDFNFDPLYDKYGYNHAFDTRDGNHMNYYGATKFSKWMGQYLVEQCGATDVRNDPKYDYIKEQNKEYNARVIQHAKLLSAEYLTEYLDVAFSGDNTVFIAARDDASVALNSNDRAFFSELGLEKLSKLDYRDSYLAVVNNGEVICEESKSSTDTENAKPLKYKGTLNDNKTTVSIESGGRKHGNTASISIGSEEQLTTDRGINIVVYSNELDMVVDATVFDTAVSSNRERYGLNNTFLLLDEDNLNKKYDPSSIEGQIVQYKEKVDKLREAEILKQSIGKNNLFGMLDAYWDDPDNIIMISVYDRAASALTDADRAKFVEYGLLELSKIQDEDSYVAYIDGGKVITDERATNEQVVMADIPGFYLKSGSAAAGKVSSIEIYGEENSRKARGINVVVYDKENNAVLASESFDTFATQIAH